MQSIQYMPVDALKPHPENARRISKSRLKDLGTSIKDNPDLLENRPLLANKDGEVFAGNQRLHAAKLIGLKKVPVVIMDISIERQREIMLRDNIHNGEWDFEKLKFFNTDLLLDVGFSDQDLSSLWAENLETTDDEFDEHTEIAKIREPKTKLGDLISLGNHKLICGDSTDPTTLSYLLGQEKASMIYSDPVYNIKIEYGKGIGGKQNYGGTVNDNRTYAEYKEFLRKSMVAALAVTKDDAHVFYWSDQCYIGYIQELYRELSIENKRVCLWIKNSQNPVPGVAFNKAYEPCTYGVRGRPYIAKNLQNLNEVMNKETSTGNALFEEISDIWLTKRLPGKDYEHATSKPPKLHEKAIRRCTRPGEIILDSFSGSASTMIAAEQLKRRAYLVELEPVFCDLAIRRFEKLTGKEAFVIGNRYEKR
jgi:DNA modification methylase